MAAVTLRNLLSEIDVLCRGFNLRLKTTPVTLNGVETEKR